MSLLASYIFEDQDELSTSIYKDLESVLGCAQEIDCIIKYLQGSQPQLVNMGLNKLFAHYNHSNLIHLEIKEQDDNSIDKIKSVQVAKNESIQIVLEVKKQISNKKIQQTLNYYIEKNLAQFNVLYQLPIIEFDQSNMYSIDLLKDLFFSDKKILDQFISRQSLQTGSTLMTKSFGSTLPTSIASIILEKIEFRKSTMMNKLEHRFPKQINVEPIIPYILGLYINIDSEGLIGDFQLSKNQLKSTDHTILSMSFNNFLPLISTEYVKLLVKLDMQQFILGNFNTQQQIEFDKIIKQEKWEDLDKSMMQQLLQSSNLKEQYDIEYYKLEQLEDLVKNLNQKIIIIFKQILPHEQGNFVYNNQIVEQLLSELEQKKNEIMKSSTLNPEIVLAIKKILQQILQIVSKYQASFHSKFGLAVLFKLKLILQDDNKKSLQLKQITSYKYNCVCQLESEISSLFKKHVIFISSELISLILESTQQKVEFEGALCGLKYGNATQKAVSEISQIQELITNNQIKQFLLNVLDYLQDRKKKKDLNFELNELQLTQYDEQILRCINNQHMITYMKDNRKLIKTISNYLLTNDPFTCLTLRSYQSLRKGLEISILALKFSKNQGLNEFFRLFFDFKKNRDSKQLKLQAQLNSSELQEWKSIVQLFE